MEIAYAIYTQNHKDGQTLLKHTKGDKSGTQRHQNGHLAH